MCIFCVCWVQQVLLPYDRPPEQRLFWLSGCPVADPSEVHGSAGLMWPDCENGGVSERWREWEVGKRQTSVPAVTQTVVRFFFFAEDFRIMEVEKCVLGYSNAGRERIQNTLKEDKGGIWTRQQVLRMSSGCRSETFIYVPSENREWSGPTSQINIDSYKLSVTEPCEDGVCVAGGLPVCQHLLLLVCDFKSPDCKIKIRPLPAGTFGPLQAL